MAHGLCGVPHLQHGSGSDIGPVQQCLPNTIHCASQSFIHFGAMAPPRAAKTPDKDDSDDKVPSWDSNYRNLKLWLLHLKRWLPLQLKQFNNFIRFGYIINSRLETVVFDNDHSDMLTDASLTAGTFEQPCMVKNGDGGPSEDEDSGEEEEEEEAPEREREASAALRTTEPLSAARIRRVPTSRSGKSKTHKTAPDALHSFDEEVLDMILSTIEDEDTADDLRDESGNSGRALLVLLHERAAKISTSDDTNIIARQDNLYKKGLSTTSLQAFNNFKSDYRALN